MTLVNSFARPFDNAIATARTCYSAKGIISAADVGADGERDEGKQRRRRDGRDALARSIYQAGHHTPLQHAHYQFTLEGISRHFVWSFLHSHPFYNSEQVSQRYVEVKRGTCVIPPLDGEALDVYERTVEEQMGTYHRLIEILTPVAEAEYVRLFPARGGQEKWRGDVKKKAQEVARYCLPVGTTTFLYHTISGLTLLRYRRLAEAFDLPLETRLVVGQMVDAMLAVDPDLGVILEDPIALEETDEAQLLAQTREVRASRAHAQEFDRELGERVSRLVDHKPGNERCVADAVRDVCGLPRAAMPDDAALAWALDPSRHRALGETLTLTAHSRLGRTLGHASYTFMKKLSHAADSQEQRHRLTPASRPIMAANLLDEPDYVVPLLVRQDAQAQRVYREAMERAWEARARLLALKVPDEFAQYLLPNALAVRLRESADLVNLHHKLRLRLCYNAQEEIWQASVQEALQIRDVNPTIGKYLLPPCTLRQMAHSSPICPEGKRYCGVPVWRLDVADYRRIL